MSDTWNGRQTKTGDPLTKRQEQVFDAIKSYQRRNGVPPTIRELSKAIGVRNMNGTVCHLRALMAKGFIKKAMENCARIYIPIVPDNCCPTCGRRVDDAGGRP